jgi:hypothetical protein
MPITEQCPYKKYVHTRTSSFINVTVVLDGALDFCSAQGVGGEARGNEAIGETQTQMGG